MSFPFAGPNTVPNIRASDPAPEIYIVNALCGAWKSSRAVAEIAACVLRGERYIIVGPTIAQTHQFAEALRAELVRRNKAASESAWKLPLASLLVAEVNVDETRRAGKGETESTVRQLLKTTIAKSPEGKGRAILITHATLLLGRVSDLPMGWHLVIDEAPSVVISTEVILPKQVFSRLVFREDTLGRIRMIGDETIFRDELRRAGSARLAATAAANKAKIEGRFDEEEQSRKQAMLILDSIETPLRNMLPRITSGFWRLSAPRSLLEADGSAGSTRRYRLKLGASDRGRLVFTSEIEWGGLLGIGEPRWKTVTLMAANLHDTFAGLTLKKQGFALVDHPTITPALRYHNQHPNGHLLRVLFASNTQMSKRKRDKAVDDRSFGEHIVEAIEREFDGQPFAWSGNLDLPDSTLSGTRMPFYAHGLNYFAAYNNTAVLSIARMNPQLEGALIEEGYTREQINTAVMCEIVYQTACRGGARNPQGTDILTIVVPDKLCADFLAARFPGCSVSPLGASEPTSKKSGRPRIHADDAARERSKKSAQRGTEREDRAKTTEDRRFQLIADVRGEPNFLMNFYGRRHHSLPCEVFRAESWDDMADVLTAAFNCDPVYGKSDNLLVLQGQVRTFNPDEMFVPMPVGPTGNITQRAEPNIISRSSLWFDVETQDHGASGSPMSPDEFKRIFDETAMCIYSSYSHRPTPIGTRYRVVMPLSHAVGVDAYHAMHDLVRARIERARWNCWKKEDARQTRFHGIDMTKRTATSLFYLPARPIGHEADAWIENVPGKPLDVLDWLGGDLSPTFRQISVPAAASDEWSPAEGDLSGPDRLLLEARVRQAMDSYGTARRGRQNTDLNTLGWRMAGLGLSRSDIGERLVEAARSSHSASDRIQQVPRVIQSLPLLKGAE